MNSEILLNALRLTAVGMGVVFAALYVLSLMMYSLPLLAGGRGKQAPTVPQASVEATASVVESAVATSAAVSSGPSPEVIAVIATAIAAYVGQTPDNLNIISIRRASAAVGPWALAARREGIQN